MPRTLMEFHGLLADMLVEARGKYDSRPGPGQPGYLNDESADAVTAWRHLAATTHSYANGASVNGGARPTWESFWRDGMDRAALLRRIVRQSRISRAIANGGDMDATTVDDSVRCWEYELALTIMTKIDHAMAARALGRADATSRISLEILLSLRVAAAYTGLTVDALREAAGGCMGSRPTYPGYADGSRVWEPHPLSDLIVANRPQV